MGIAISIFLIVIGSLAIQAGIKTGRLLREAGAWPSVKGKLTGKWLDEPARSSLDGANEKMVRVTYEYEVNNIAYKGCNAYATELLKAQRTALSRQQKRLLDRIPADPVIFYDPSDPSRSFIWKDSAWISRMFIAAGITCIAVALPVLLYNLLPG